MLTAFLYVLVALNAMQEIVFFYGLRVLCLYEIFYTINNAEFMKKYLKVSAKVMPKYFESNGSLDMLHRMNLEKVYKNILIHHKISQAGIVMQTRLSKATVSTCVNMLIRNGIIIESGESPSSTSAGGRPAKQLVLHQNAGLFLSVEVNIVGNLWLTDACGNQILQERLPELQNNPECLVQYLKEKVEQYKTISSRTRYGILGICLIVPINYNIRTGVVEMISSMPKWRNTPIRRMLEDAFPKINIFVCSASTAGSIGEIHFGQSDPMNYMIYLLDNWGISVSVYSKGLEHIGRDGFAGRFGHTIIEPRGRLCACGNHGCLEAYASVSPLIIRLAPEASSRYEGIEQILKMKENGSAAFKEAIAEVTDYLALGICNLVNSYNPSEICIGGYMARLLTDDELRRIHKKIETLLPSQYIRGLRVYCSTLAEKGPIIGGIAMMRDEMVGIILNRIEKENDTTQS